MSDKTTQAYIAGLVDGEGYISLTKDKGKYRYASVVITNTDLKVLKYIQSIYKGSIQPQKKQKSHHTQSYNWRVVTAQAREMLKDIRPYLRIKAKKADEILTYPVLKYRTKT